MKHKKWVGVLVRKKKFGEETDFVNVRVPKSKKAKYREAINNLVDEIYKKDSESELEGRLCDDKGIVAIKFKDLGSIGKDIAENSGKSED